MYIILFGLSAQALTATFMLNYKIPKSHNIHITMTTVCQT